MVDGEGEMWRRAASGEERIRLEPGVSLVLTVGTAFQFRATTPLTVFAVTMPPWPEDRTEADVVDGPWLPTLSAS